MIREIEVAQPRPAEQPDEWWVEQARQNPRAYEELVLRYQGRLYNLAYRLTGDSEGARDLVQEALVQAYVALSGFRTGERFSPCIYKITVNLCINYLKRKRTKASRDEDSYAAHNASGLEKSPKRGEAQASVQRALMGLPEQYRAAILLRHQQQLPYADIAHALGLRIGAVREHVFKAREMLHGRLSCEDEFSLLTVGRPASQGSY